MKSVAVLALAVASATAFVPSTPITGLNKAATRGSSR